MLRINNTYKSDISNVLMHLPAATVIRKSPCLLLSSKAWNETNIVFHESLEAWSSPLLSSLTFHPSGASPGPLIKERVCLSIFLTATHAEQRHTNMHTHSRLHLSQWSHLIRSLDTTQRYLEKMFPPPSRNTDTPNTLPYRKTKHISSLWGQIHSRISD